MKTNCWLLLLLAGVLSLPAASLQAETISAASMCAEEAAAERAAAAPQGVDVSLEVLALAESRSELSGESALRGESAADVEPSASVPVNLTPVGIMVAAHAVNIVPEPSTVVLLSCGALGVFWAARRNRRK